MSRINSNDILFQLPVQGCLNTLVTINPPESTLHCGLRSQSHGDSSRSSRAPRAVFPPEETAAAGTLPPRALLLSHHCGHHVLLMIDSPVLVAPAHLVPTWCPPGAHLMPTWCGSAPTHLSPESRTAVHPSPTYIMRPMRSWGKHAWMDAATVSSLIVDFKCSESMILMTSKRQPKVKYAKPDISLISNPFLAGI